MASEPQLETEIDEPERAAIPPPVPDGDYELESLGRFVDNLLGSARRQATADRRMGRLVGRTEAPEDPPSVEIPEPVPDGDDPFTDGEDPGGTETREG